MTSKQNKKNRQSLAPASKLAALSLFFLTAILNIDIFRLISHANQTEGSGNSLILNGNGVAVNGRLSVRGTQLVNQQGKPVQLRGMSSHGLQWFPQYANARAMWDLKSRGSNVFRAAMYADSTYGGYNESEKARTWNEAMMYLAVENAIATDLYVIADWHVLHDETPLKTVDSAIDFFDRISAHYAGYYGVIYEICNEPNGPTTWDDVYLYAEQVIPVIRKNSPDAVILVGNPKYSSDLSGPLVKPLPFDNIMYTYHLYTGDSDYFYLDILPAALEDGLPVFVSEWGISTDPNTGELDVAEAHDFIAFMKDNMLSWVNWSLCNKDEDYSAIKPEVAKLSGWTENDLTDSGRIIFNAFKSDVEN